MATIRNAQTGIDITQSDQTDTARRTAGQERVKQASTAVMIRLFGTRDYEAVVAVHNAVFPDRPGTVEEWRCDDEHLDARCANERYVAEEQTGEVLGFAGLWQTPWAFSPRTFEAEIRVHPGARRRGIGRRLWERLAEALRARDALLVKTQVWEAMPAGAAFAARLGFREVLRPWEIRTWNETHNQRMLAINTKLGFVRQPAWITLQKDLRG